VDDPEFVLPEFENKITPVSGAIDSGAVNPGSWKLFIAYHDDEIEPGRPSGDGQGSGWHYAQTLRSVWQSSKMAESVNLGEWGPPVRIKNERGETDVVPVYLALSPQSKTLECDGDGNVLAGLLPFTSQAALYKWNTKLAASMGAEYFPGTGGNLFDPMLGDLVPFSPMPDLVFSLPDAPEGVAISNDGVITVGADAVLEDENSIAVRAEYRGSIYAAVLFIARDTRAYASRYLGTVDALTETAAVMIVKGPVQGRVRARQGDFVLAIADGTVGGLAWGAGSVYQWSGLAWEYRAPDRFADLYTRCFADGLDVPGLAQDMGWFGAVFARLLVAQQAFIETLEAQVLKITGAVYGGNRFDKDGNVIDENKQGWHLGGDGILKAFRGIFNNIALTASSFEITANNKGYLPIGFVYIQFRGQPAPQELFSGVWENISWQYAGLFFRVEGGNAAGFGQDQGQSTALPSHSHGYNALTNNFPKRVSTNINPANSWADIQTDIRSVDTNTSGNNNETRPANTTIRVWIRRS
jgi:hypothetical protein